MNKFGIIYLAINEAILYTHNGVITPYYKIGFTEQTTETRMYALDGTGTLPGYNVICAMLVNNPRVIESTIHRIFKDDRVLKSRELFMFSNQQITDVIAVFVQYGLVDVSDYLDFLPTSPYGQEQLNQSRIKKELQNITDQGNNHTIIQNTSIPIASNNIYDTMKNKVNNHRHDISTAIKNAFIKAKNGVCVHSKLMTISATAAKLTAQEERARVQGATRPLNHLATIVEYTLSEMKKPNNKHGIHIKGLHAGMYKLVK